MKSWKQRRNRSDVLPLYEALEMITKEEKKFDGTIFLRSHEIRYFCEVTKLDIKLRITTRIKISGKWNWFAKNFYCHKTTCRTYDSSAVPIINMPSKSQVATQCVAHNEEIGCHRLGPCRGGQGGTRSRAPKGPNNVASAFFHLLPKDLRFEHSAPKLFLAPGAIKPRYVPA